MTEARGEWERRYQASGSAEERGWYVDRPPDELIHLLDQVELPAGASLDVGCGPGVITSFLARRFTPSVGLDIAATPLVEARRRAEEEGTKPSFLIAEAQSTPFLDGAFVFIVDRGCMQHLEKEQWTSYLQEVGRVLRPEGVFELFYSRPPGGSSRLAKMRTNLRRRALGERPPVLSRSDLDELLGGSLSVMDVEHTTFEMRNGRVRTITHATFRKPES